MARRAEQYSRLISWLKIVLPLAALALLSTLFLLARDVDQVVNLPFAEVLSPEGQLEEQVGAPYFAGTTANGELLTMAASRAKPLGSDRIEAMDVTASMTLHDGDVINLRSDDAILIENSNEALLSGAVRFSNTGGYTLDTEVMITSLDTVRGESEGTVNGQGPTGTLEAGKMQFDTDPETGGIQLLFTGGVKLVYTPKN